ncbi:S-adenosyl-L-methionine-dependent methyltransferase [Lentithecium fluviatile CBS 122367]|uniref:S-adenosyl-L-methionine-dependent methyltransferase n=1 Tax=Lentithecium fluviatile CBS 122367 TaxID=1168545 RepID=A0A6G1ITP1_9PLEO|nr:S-adenosyl-L-methionine-dependent methyltransferase [Lentithecium fluviatile CBS 122367]
MEPMAHDFFTPQPIMGTRAYYLRNILHDWGDEKCLIILLNKAAAMKPWYSKVLVNEFAIFRPRPLCLLGAIERAEKQWRELLTTAGLQIERIWTAEPESQSIIEARLAGPGVDDGEST